MSYMFSYSQKNYIIIFLDAFSANRVAFTQVASKLQTLTRHDALEPIESTLQSSHFQFPTVKTN